MSELVELADFYSPPHRLLLAFDEASGKALGVVALRQLTPHSGEVRRLFVRPAGRTRGTGRQLVERLIDSARNDGMTEFYLDTLPFMHHARRLYESLGFTPCEPYTDDFPEGALFFRLGERSRNGQGSPSC